MIRLFLFGLRQLPRHCIRKVRAWLRHWRLSFEHEHRLEWDGDAYVCRDILADGKECGFTSSVHK